MTKAKRELLVAEIPHLRRYARALLRDAGAADDLVQSCLERALGRFHLWQPHRRLRPWLFTIMHNLHVNAVRQRASRPAVVSLSEVTKAPSVAPAQEGVLESRSVLEAIDRLPDEQRMAVVLVGLRDLSYSEAAVVLGVPLGTLMSRLHRGRERLRQTLGWAGARPAIRGAK